MYSFCIFHIATGGDKLGGLTRPLLYFSTLPETVWNSFSERALKDIPDAYVRKDASFKAKNNLKYDLYGLRSHLEDQNKASWEIRLFNFKTDSVLNTWHLERRIMDSVEGTKAFENCPPRHCILLQDSSIVGILNESNCLFKLDKHSRLVWVNTNRNFHSTLELGADSSLWVGTKEKAEVINPSGKVITYRDDHITKIDPVNGEILYDKSISRMFIENGLQGMLYGTIDRTEYGGRNPINLSDIEPVLRNTEHWQKGSLLISQTNNSLIYLYNPRHNKITKVLHGPFHMQEDVDIVSGNSISIYNNNSTSIGKSGWKRHFTHENLYIRDSLKHKNILEYDFSDSAYHVALTLPHKNALVNPDYLRKGNHKRLKSGDIYVEIPEEGKVLILNNQKVLYRKQFSTSQENWVEWAHGIRIYQEYPL